MLTEHNMINLHRSCSTTYTRTSRRPTTRSSCCRSAGGSCERNLSISIAYLRHPYDGRWSARSAAFACSLCCPSGDRSPENRAATPAKKLRRETGVDVEDAELDLRKSQRGGTYKLRQPVFLYNSVTPHDRHTKNDVDRQHEEIII